MSILTIIDKNCIAIAVWMRINLTHTLFCLSDVKLQIHKTLVHQELTSLSYLSISSFVQALLFSNRNTLHRLQHVSRINRGFHSVSTKRVKWHKIVLNLILPKQSLFKIDIIHLTQNKIFLKLAKNKCLPVWDKLVYIKSFGKKIEPLSRILYL